MEQEILHLGIEIGGKRRATEARFSASRQLVD